MPLHIAITRRVRPGCEADFQQLVREFFQTSFAHQSVLGATMLVPPPGSDSHEFGILRTFTNEQERDEFYASPIFNAWEERCKPLTEAWLVNLLIGNRFSLHINLFRRFFEVFEEGRAEPTFHFEFR